jgi:uncharacterized protein with HEPN domain
MRPDAAALLWAARRAAQRVHDFIADREFSDYQQDVLLRSAVERQFEILGESLNRLSRADPLVASSIPDLPRMVAFRNILIQGYATVDHAIVWDVAITRLPGTIALLDSLLTRQDAEGGDSQNS